MLNFVAEFRNQNPDDHVYPPALKRAVPRITGCFLPHYLTSVPLCFKQVNCRAIIKNRPSGYQKRKKRKRKQPQAGGRPSYLLVREFRLKSVLQQRERVINVYLKMLTKSFNLSKKYERTSDSALSRYSASSISFELT